MVGSGEELYCNQVCNKVKLLIQGHLFHVDLHVLELSGAYIVLGAQWLKQLEPVLMDYRTFTMNFNGPSYMELKGDAYESPTTISYRQFQKIIQGDHAAQLFSLRAFDPQIEKPIVSQLTHTYPNVQQLILQYSSLFDEPKHLPPPPPSDHSIPLLPYSAPVNVRPYRYPYAQKLEIEAQVTKLLENGWIQPSNSPFSSPVLLLKMKDGSWRMCVDYRGLNALTIKWLHEFLASNQNYKSQ